MEGLIAKFIVIFLWGILIGGVTGFLSGSLLTSAKFRDITAEKPHSKEDAENARKTR